MEKLDKVIAGLECHYSETVDYCKGVCPYYGEHSCVEALLQDALRVLPKVKKRLDAARAERDAARAKLARITGEREVEWLEKVHPDWYERLSKLEFEYDPVKNGEPWYRAEDVWACIEEVSE